ncbi:CidB/LrgB family autolysis modulator [Escherichia coli]|uniref:CidB/LrgB family autolysis modulator n=1 Tax=Escherichia coli TaxID=562 RepID=UPI000CFB15F6|nr:CidB/LrgB family autolysis modulator [Escherichia coli]
MMTDILWSLPLTLVIFFVARWLAMHKIKTPLFNPLLITMIVIIAILVTGHISYTHYFHGSSVLNSLLQPAVVALAYPLYEQLPQLRRKWKSLFGICLLGSLVAMFSGAIIALALGATPQMAATILPKSVTTPIAMAASSAIGGIPAITAVCVIVVGILGAVLGHIYLNAVKIHTKTARGLSMGTASHALGTSRCAELDAEEAACSSVALVLCGIITSILAPFVFKIVLILMN